MSTEGLQENMKIRVPQEVHGATDAQKEAWAVLRGKRLMAYSVHHVARIHNLALEGTDAATRNYTGWCSRHSVESCAVCMCLINHVVDRSCCFVIWEVNC